MTVAFSLQSVTCVLDFLSLTQMLLRRGIFKSPIFFLFLESIYFQLYYIVVKTVVSRMFCWNTFFFFVDVFTARMT